jgi:hypothetical protein
MTLKAFYSKKNLCELAQKLGLITSDGVWLLMGNIM